MSDFSLLVDELKDASPESYNFSDLSKSSSKGISSHRTLWFCLHIFGLRFATLEQYKKPDLPLLSWNYKIPYIFNIFLWMLTSFEAYGNISSLKTSSSAHGLLTQIFTYVSVISTFFNICLTHLFFIKYLESNDLQFHLLEHESKYFRQDVAYFKNAEKFFLFVYLPVHILSIICWGVVLHEFPVSVVALCLIGLVGLFGGFQLYLLMFVTRMFEHGIEDLKDYIRSTIINPSSTFSESCFLSLYLETEKSFKKTSDKWGPWFACVSFFTIVWPAVSIFLMLTFTLSNTPMNKMFVVAVLVLIAENVGILCLDLFSILRVNESFLDLRRLAMTAPINSPVSQTQSEKEQIHQSDHLKLSSHMSSRGLALSTRLHLAQFMDEIPLSFSVFGITPTTQLLFKAIIGVLSIVFPLIIKGFLSSN